MINHLRLDGAARQPRKPQGRRLCLAAEKIRSLVLDIRPCALSKGEPCYSHYCSKGVPCGTVETCP